MDENNFDNFSVPGTNSGDGVNDAVNNANDAFNNASNAAESAGNSVLDNVADAVDAVGNAADSVADTVADAISGAVNGASDALNGNVNTGSGNLNGNINVNTGADNSFSQPAIQPDAVYTNNGQFVSPAPQQEGSKVLSIVSLVCGILSVITCCCYGGLPFGIAALITGIISKKKNLPGGGMALAGIITGAVGTLTGLISLIWLIISIISGAGAPSYSSYLN